jgi:2-dehydro-3-deoxyglucarate aldolase/4-hydroxy-2-oxoheptanedioate aldolase
MQHGHFDRTTLEYALRAVPNGVSTLVRVAKNSVVAIGLAGCRRRRRHYSSSRDRREAAFAVAAARFQPVGRRSGGGVRPVSSDFGASCAASNECTVVGVMIETGRGVFNASAIASTPGVDFVLIGSGDLSLSLASSSLQVEDACRKILQICRAGIPCAIYYP